MSANPPTVIIVQPRILVGVGWFVKFRSQKTGLYVNYQISRALFDAANAVGATPAECGFDKTDGSKACSDACQALYGQKLDAIFASLALPPDDIWLYQGMCSGLAFNTVNGMLDTLNDFWPGTTMAMLNIAPNTVAGIMPGDFALNGQTLTITGQLVNPGTITIGQV